MIEAVPYTFGRQKEVKSGHIVLKRGYVYRCTKCNRYFENKEDTELHKCIRVNTYSKETGDL
jgi:hypothetical protein